MYSETFWTGDVCHHPEAGPPFLVSNPRNLPTDDGVNVDGMTAISMFLFDTFSLSMPYRTRCEEHLFVSNTVVIVRGPEGLRNRYL